MNNRKLSKIEKKMILKSMRVFGEMLIERLEANPEFYVKTPECGLSKCCGGDCDRILSGVPSITYDGD